jgi:hypothetical protein
MFGIGYADLLRILDLAPLADARDDYLVISPLAAYSADWPTLSMRRASRSRGSSGPSVKLWVPTAEDVLKIVVKDFGPCL